jgi:hypothetical protein
MLFAPLSNGLVQLHWTRDALEVEVADLDKAHFRRGTETSEFLADEHLVGAS